MIMESLEIVELALKDGQDPVEIDRHTLNKIRSDLILSYLIKNHFRPSNNFVAGKQELIPTRKMTTFQKMVFSSYFKENKQ